MPPSSDTDYLRESAAAVLRGEFSEDSPGCGEPGPRSPAPVHLDLATQLINAARYSGDVTELAAAVMLGSRSYWRLGELLRARAVLELAAFVACERSMCTEVIRSCEASIREGEQWVPGFFAESCGRVRSWVPAASGWCMDTETGRWEYRPSAAIPPLLDPVASRQGPRMLDLGDIRIAALPPVSTRYDRSVTTWVVSCSAREVVASVVAAKVTWDALEVAGRFAVLSVEENDCSFAVAAAVLASCSPVVRGAPDEAEPPLDAALLAARSLGCLDSVKARLDVLPRARAARAARRAEALDRG